jgi:CHAT domain-containing protein
MTRVLSGGITLVSFVFLSCGASEPNGPDARASFIARLKGESPVALELAGLARIRPCLPDPSGYCWATESLRGIPNDLKAERRGAPADLAAQALRALLVRRGADAPRRALWLLRKAVAGEPENATFQLDLALALWLRYRSNGEPADLFEALEWTERARQLAPERSAAHANRARLYLELGSVPKAREAWIEALAAGLASPVAEEAYRFLEQAEGHREPEQVALARFEAGLSASGIQAAVALAPQAARTWLTTVGWPRWQESVAASEPARALEALEDVAAVAQALAVATGDNSEASVARWALGLAWQPQLELAAYREFAQGVGLYFQRRNAEAARALERFLAGPQPRPLAWQRWARYYLAVVRAHERGSAGAEELERIRREASEQGHVFLVGRALWSQGLAASERADLALARDRYEAAKQALERAGMPGEAAYIEILLADLDAREGLGQRALKRSLGALPRLREWGTSARLASALAAIGERASEQGWYAGALALADEAIEWSLAAPRPSVRVDAYLSRAKVRSQAGDRAGGEWDLQAAENSLLAISDATIRAREEAAWLAAHGELGISTSGEERRRQLDRVIEYQASREGEILLLDLLIVRADLALAEGDLGAAQADLRLARQQLPRWHRGGRASTEEQAFLSRVERIFEREIELLLREPGREAAAFDLAREAQTVTRSRAEIRDSALAASSARLWSYALEDEVLVRCESSAEAQTFRVKVSRKDLLSWSGQAASELARQKPGAEARSVLSSLYQALVGPCEPWLQGASELVFVLDGRLGALPLGALLDAVSGRFLVESFVVREEPSVLGPDRPQSASPEPARFLGLAVPGPEGEALLSERLGRLEEVEAEVRSVAELYPRAEVVSGSRATAATLLRNLPGVDVFHFGGHGLPATAERPSVLVVAGDPPLLGSEDLRRLNLSRLQLVVLGACGSAGQGRGVGGRLLDLAFPFLDAGAHSVVLATAQVYDQRARPLLTSLHRHFAAGASPSESLREAQLEVLRAADDPIEALPSWAPWSVVGRR